MDGAQVPGPSVEWRHVFSRSLRFAAKILYEIMLFRVSYARTKPDYMRRPWRICPSPCRPWRGISAFDGDLRNSNLGQLHYPLTRDHTPHSSPRPGILCPLRCGQNCLMCASVCRCLRFVLVKYRMIFINMI